MRRLTLGAIVSSLLLLCSSLLILPTPASAYSGYGTGASTRPYRIASCSQLKEIDSNLAGYYMLVSDIDCGGSVFASIANSADFTGTLDGQNHTIANLNISGSGLFKSTSGATIKNLAIASGTISSADAAGSFASITHSTTLSNVHSSMTISGGEGSTNGGLVGLSYNNLNISASSYSGTITSSVYSGGLVGLIYDTGTNLITNSFFNGTFTLTGTTTPMPNPSFDNGGLVGLMYGGTITNSYSSGTINFDTGAYVFGGLVGDTYNGVFNNNFSALAYSGSSPDTFGAGFGAFYTGGSYSSARSNIYYDQYLANSSGSSLPCVGFDDSSGNCTAENISNASPGYFKNNTSNGPFGAWDFTNIWATTTGYPTLRNLSAFASASVPNGGDANGDGVADSYQANVSSIKDANGVWSTVTIPSSSGCTLDSPASVDANAIRSDGGFSAMVKYDAFSVYCSASGLTVPVTIIYDKQYDTNGVVLRYYNSTTKTYSNVAGVVFGTTVIGGTPKTTVTYSLTDGSSMDNDGTSNGVIVDPVAIARVGAPATGYGFYSRASYTAAMLAIFSTALIALGYVILHKRLPTKP